MDHDKTRKHHDVDTHKTDEREDELLSRGARVPDQEYPGRAPGVHVHGEATSGGETYSGRADGDTAGEDNRTDRAGTDALGRPD
jgi:hypothetical protein